MMNVNFIGIAVAISFTFTGLLVLAAMIHAGIEDRDETDRRITEALDTAYYADEYVRARIADGEYDWDNTDRVRTDFAFAKMMYRESV